MRTLRISLIGDGPSDRCLLVIIRRLIGEMVGDVAIESNWADLRFLKTRPVGLADRIQATLVNYPCDILFVHRDAEGQSWEERVDEIRAAIRPQVERWVAVVPVRMTEAWLMLDEVAIRSAADHPKGTNPLDLPKAQAAERDSDPKETLRRALVKASEKTGRQLRRFRETINERVQRVAEIMSDYSGLQLVHSYRRLREDTAVALRSGGYLRTGTGDSS